MRCRAIATVAAVMASPFSPAAAPAEPKVDALVAITRLEESRNFTWKTTIPSPGGRGTIITGQLETGGYATIRMTAFRTTTRTVGYKNWSVSETELGWLAPEQARRLRVMYEAPPFRTPVQDLKAMIETCDQAAIVGNVISGSFNAAGAERMWLLRLGRDDATQGSGAVKSYFRNPSGDFRIWLKDGQITKYELYLNGMVLPGCFPGEMSITTTTEISAVGTTKVVVPLDAKAALKELDPS